MQGLLNNPFVARVMGAAGAGLTAHIVGGQSWTASGTTALGFLLYGAIHTSTTAVTDGQK